MVIGRAVVYYARVAQAFSARIKGRHCTFASTPQNVDFAHYVPILKLRTTSLTFQLYRSLQWANFTMGFMSKFNILLSLVKKICLYTYINDYVYICVYQRFAKVGCQWRTQTFGNKTREKRSVKLGTDRL